MGSLMAGWQTNRLDTRQTLLRSNSSLTNEEVKRFWRAKQNAIRRHLEEATSLRSGSESEDLSPPSSPDSSAPAVAAVLISDLGSPKSDWWTKSTWAFLNQPPLSEIKQSLYTPQFDVASRVGRDEPVGTTVITYRGL